MQAESIGVTEIQGYIFWPFPQGGLEKRKGKGGKRRKKKSDKTHVKIPL